MQEEMGDIEICVAEQQFFKCANKLYSLLPGLDDFDCPLWQIADGSSGCFNETGYVIDHIEDYCMMGDDIINNLQALCLACHTEKTNRFMMNRRCRHIASIELIKACESDDVQRVVALLADENTDPSYNNYTALRIACINRFTDIIDLLVKHPVVSAINKPVNSVRNTCSVIEPPNHTFEIFKDFFDEVFYLTDNEEDIVSVTGICIMFNKWSYDIYDAMKYLTRDQVLDYLGVFHNNFDRLRVKSIKKRRFEPAT